MTTIRRIAPYVLLAAYMPLLVALSFHTHTDQHSEAAECPDCAHHIHHKAHLSEAAVMAHDCIYCQLTSSSYYGTNTIQAPDVLSLIAKVCDAVECSVDAEQCGFVSLRAPPIQ